MKKYGKKNSAARDRKIPAIVREDMSKHANLPTDVMMMDYPYCESVPQRLDDSINYSDKQQRAGVSGVRKQLLDKAY